MGALEIGLGLGDGDLEGFLIYFEQKVPRLHKLVIDHRNIGHHAGDPGCDLDNVATHLAVPGPGVVDVFLEGLVGVPGHSGDKRQVDGSETEFLEKFHRHRPLYFYPESVH